MAEMNKCQNHEVVKSFTKFQEYKWSQHSWKIVKGNEKEKSGIYI